MTEDAAGQDGGGKFAQIKSLKQQVKQLEDELAAAREQRTALENDTSTVEGLKASYDHMKKMIQTQAKTMAADGKKMKELQEQIVEKDARIEDLMKQLKNQAPKDEKKMYGLSKTMTMVQNTAGDAHASQHESDFKMQVLKNEVKRLQGLNEQLENSLKQKDQELDKKNDDTELQNEIVVLQTEIQARDAQIVGLSQELLDAKANQQVGEVEMLQKEIEQKNQQISSATDRIKQIIIQKDKEINELIATLRDKEQIVEQLNKQLSAQNIKIQTIIHKSQSTQLSDLEIMKLCVDILAHKNFTKAEDFEAKSFLVQTAVMIDKTEKSVQELKITERADAVISGLRDSKSGITDVQSKLRLSEVNEEVVRIITTPKKKPENLLNMRDKYEDLRQEIKQVDIEKIKQIQKILVSEAQNKTQEVHEQKSVKNYKLQVRLSDLK